MRTASGSEHYFNRSALLQLSDWESLSLGAEVSFKLEAVEHGDPQAVKIQVLAPGKVVREEVGQELKGVVRQLKPGRGFGFIRCTDGPSFFFHRSMVSNVSDWMELEEESQVQFEVGINPQDGRICAKAVRLLNE